MTAEVAVINKSAIALASDSAVTIELIDSNGRNNDKIYNTANKLFSLSKYAPVGIMVYNTMELGGVPWETIIKEYRRHLKDTRLDLLEDYASDFWKYLGQNKILFEEEQLLDVLFKILCRFFSSLKPEITNNPLAKTAFDKQIAELEKLDFAESFSEHDASLTEALINVIDRAVKVVFDPLLIADLQSEYRKLAMLAITKSEQLSGYTGIVFAGFGEKDIFPKLIEFQTDLVFFGKVRKKQINKYRPDQFKAGKVLSFAQDDITQTILTGINPGYADQVRSDAIDFLLQLPKTIIDGIAELTDEQKTHYKDKSFSASIGTIKDFFLRMEKEREEKHTFPIEKAIQMMPFSELAEIAELFIKLTQVRRRLSPDSETVGGPIDVAVISKADGFVWIKRKFYFDKELNYSFLQNYLS